MSGMSPSQAVTAYLNEIPPYLSNPLFPVLLATAGQLRNPSDAAIILELMGPAASYGLNHPTSLRFPEDHGLHLDMGTEWYWMSANLDVEGAAGPGKIGVIVIFFRGRPLSLAVQKEAGWSDEACQIVNAVATVTVATGNESFIVRRSTNIQWPAMGGSIAFSSIPFLYQCGPDAMRGSPDVLPLNVTVDDGTNMQIDLTLSSELSPEFAFFRQANDGISPSPFPGLYYSWPQLQVQGTVEVRGASYNVKGTGWIDHQVDMASTAPPSLPQPYPPQPAQPFSGFVPVQHYSGWSWCQFNLDNGDAITCSGFQNGTIRTQMTVPPTGIYVRRKGDMWETISISGSLAIDRFIPMLGQISMPTDWTYTLGDDTRLLADLRLMATPWYPDGSFETANCVIAGETPVSVAAVDFTPLNTASGRGRTIGGTGYCESVAYESVESYTARALARLALNGAASTA